MSNILKTLAAGSAAGAYQISRSLRFNSADSAYLSRTPASNGSQRKATFSCWLKKGRNGLGSTSPSTPANQNMIMGFGATNANDFILLFQNDDTLLFVARNSSSTVAQLQTNAVYRDNSSWMHIVLSVDTENATSGDRIRIYVNGTEVTSFSTETQPTQNTDFGALNSTSYTGYIGNNRGDTTGYFNGYMTEVHFIDGQALTPSSFGEINEDTGVWSPIRYAGSYGTTGFYLNFSDNSGVTSSTLGKDSSGNNNDWTPNNFSVTAGVGNDSLVDVPTPYGVDTGAGGEVRGNYATLNPLDPPTTNFTKTGTNGNLDGVITSSGAGGCGFFTTQSVSTGKWYVEITVNSFTVSGNFDLGIINASQTRTTGNGTYGAIGYSPYGYCVFTSGAYGNNNTSSSSGTSYTTTDVIGIAFDADNGKLWFRKNGTWMSSGDPAAGTNAAFTSIPAGDYVFGFGDAAGTSGRSTGATLNAGQRPFAYTAPSGFKALCTTNLPDPTVVQGGDYFNTVLWTGDGATTATPITGVGFQPDFVWIKERTLGYNHVLQDAVRGVAKKLGSNLTSAENDATTLPLSAGYISSFDSDGFTLESSGTPVQTNRSGSTYVGWNWKANGAGVSNTDGSITSTVSANTTAGISIVTYTGTGSNATVGHGLGSVPKMIIVKDRSSGIQEWAVYHASLGANNWIQLQSTGASVSNSAVWNNTTPTSSVFSLGTAGVTNANTDNFVAYCFAEVEGFSKFGSYTGNSSTDGPFVYTGFRPAFVLIKRTDSTGFWAMLDNNRPSYNPTDMALYANASNAESTPAQATDFLSNGFKLKTLDSDVSSNGGTHIFMAFAENPFKYALAR
jgi:hypothetical protein